ncbi:MAG: hypothetical protein KF894_11310 [Labilithrix sp.]|nr:hypothetical protein [Labilithrix sp.]
MKHLAKHRSMRRLAPYGVIGTATLSMLVACADSVVLGSEDDAPDGGTVTLPPSDGGGVDVDVDAAPPEAGPDADGGIPICSKDGFCHSVLPQGQHLVDVWGDGQGTVWTVSREGNILRWDGSAWTIHHSVAGEARSVWGSGPTDVWVATSLGLLRGQGETAASLVFSFVPDLPGDEYIPLQSVSGTGPNDVWIVGSVESYDSYPPDFYNRVIHYGGDDADGGTGFTLDDDLSSRWISFRRVWASPGAGIWVHGMSVDDEGWTYARVFQRPAGASTWTEFPLPRDPSNMGTTASTVYGAGLSSDSTVVLRGQTLAQGSALWRGTSADNGQTFSFSYAPEKAWHRWYYAFWGTAPDDTWGVGAQGLLNHWDGTKWDVATARLGEVPIDKSFFAIWGTTTDDFWVVGDEIAVHKTNAGKP